MSILFSLLFIAAIITVAYFIVRKKSPATADKIWTAVAGAAAAVFATLASWFGGLFDKIGS